MALVDPQFLREANPLSKDLDDEAFELWRKSFVFEKHSKDSVLLKDGEQQHKFYVITEGIVHRIKDGILKATYEKGQVTGFHHFVSQDPSPAELKCGTDVELYSMNSDTFYQILAQNPKLSPCILKHLTREVRKHLNYMASILKDGIVVTFYDSKQYWEKIFNEENEREGDDGKKKYGYKIQFQNVKLGPLTTYAAQGAYAVCVFVNDVVDRATIQGLYREGVRLIALRCAGYNNVDLDACKEYGLSVVRVPAYSPYAVAEHSVALILALNRKIHRAHNRTKEANFALDGLVGFDIHGKTVGVFGTGKIGRCFIDIMKGFGAKVIAYDKYPSEIPGVENVSFEELLKRSHIISIHAPLTPETARVMNEERIQLMKKGALLINTSRGGLVDTAALINAIESGHLGGAGLDVYENEKAVFFEDHSDQILTDRILARLATFNNVILTGHQAFLTQEALSSIASNTLENIRLFINGTRGDAHPNLVKPEY